MSDQDKERPSGQIVLYQQGDDAGAIRVLLEGNTAWLTQRLLAELYQTSVPNINQHISSIYGDGELQPEATINLNPLHAIISRFHGRFDPQWGHRVSNLASMLFAK